MGLVLLVIVFGIVLVLVELLSCVVDSVLTVSDQIGCYLHAGAHPCDEVPFLFFAPGILYDTATLRLPFCRSY